MPSSVSSDDDVREPGQSHGDDAHWNDVVAVQGERDYIVRVVQNFNDNLKSGAMQPEIESIVLALNADLVKLATSKVQGHDQQNQCNIASNGDSRQAVGRNVDREVCTSTPKVETNLPRKQHGDKGDCCGTSSNRGNNSSVCTMDDLVSALGKLDLRPVPTPDTFDPNSGQSFSDFLETFEQYCKQNFRGDSKLWGSQLCKFISGDVRQAYDALKVPGEDYYELKGKLVDWLASSKDKLEYDSKQRFSEAKRNGGEAIRLYAARLQKIFQIAYPRRVAESSRALRDKFLDTVPGRFRDQVLTAESVRSTLDSAETGWSHILAMASKFDARDFSKGKPVDDCNWVESSRSGMCSCSSKSAVSTQEVWQVNAGSTPSAGRPSTDRTGNYTIERGEQGQRVFSKQGILSPNREMAVECFYCGREGHMKRDCRKRLRQCFGCGSTEHRIAECTELRSTKQSRMTGANLEKVGNVRGFESKEDLNSGLPKF